MHALLYTIHVHVAHVDMYVLQCTCVHYHYFQVDGIDAHVIPVYYGVTSSPIYFQPTATYDNTLIRYCVSYLCSSLLSLWLGWGVTRLIQKLSDGTLFLAMFVHQVLTV